jgi:hypothetical protein
MRSPEECEGILIVGHAEGAERRDIEGVADVGEPVQNRRPPNCKSRSGGRKAERQDERDPRELAEPLAQQVKQLLRRTTHRRGCGALGLDRHEKYVSRRSQLVGLGFMRS